MNEKLRHWLFGLDPGLAHRLGFGAAWLADRFASRYLRRTYTLEDSALHQRIWNLDFPNPVGLAAGCDKNALLLPFWAKLGFGHAEVGSVTLRRSRGNPRPRLFRLEEDRAIINRLGLPSKGAHRVAQRLSSARVTGMPVGVSIARVHGNTSPIEDYRRCAARLIPHADYLTVNISCPNTPDGKTFETPKYLDELLVALMGEVDGRVPVLIKLSPLDTPKVIYDSQTEGILETAISRGVSGFVVANTAKDRAGLVADKHTLDTIGPGGLSGAPLHHRAVQMVRYIYSCVGPRYPIIGVGGIFSAEDAYRMIRAGACLLQLYTGLVYEGPSVVYNIKHGLMDLLEADGFGSLQSAVGTEQGIKEIAGIV